MRGLKKSVMGGVVMAGVWGAALAGGCSSTGDASDMSMVARGAEVGCGACRFGMETGGCDLAVKIHDKTYLVEGVSIDDFGDAHAADGLCMTTRRATVSGHIEGDRFIAESIALEP